MDNILIYLIQSYNVEAFNILFNKYYKLSKIWAKDILKMNEYFNVEFEYLESDLINNLYRAFESYDSSKGVFYSYIKKAVNFTVRNYMRDLQKSIICSYSLDSEIEENILLMDVIASEDNMSKILERYHLVEEVDEFLDKVSLFKEDDQLIVKLKMQGYSANEIFKMTGFNMRKISYILSKVKKM